MGLREEEIWDNFAVSIITISSYCRCDNSELLICEGTRFLLCVLIFFTALANDYIIIPYLS